MQFLKLEQPLLDIRGLTCGRINVSQGTLIFTEAQARRYVRIMQGNNQIDRATANSFLQQVVAANVAVNVSAVLDAVESEWKMSAGSVVRLKIRKGGSESPLPYGVLSGHPEITAVGLWNLELAISVLHHHASAGVAGITAPLARGWLCELRRAEVPDDPEVWEKRVKALPAAEIEAWEKKTRDKMERAGGAMKRVQRLLGRQPS